MVKPSLQAMSKSTCRKAAYPTARLVRRRQARQNIAKVSPVQSYTKIFEFSTSPVVTLVLLDLWPMNFPEAEVLRD